MTAMGFQAHYEIIGHDQEFFLANWKRPFSSQTSMSAAIITAAVHTFAITAMVATTAHVATLISCLAMEKRAFP